MAELQSGFVCRDGESVLLESRIDEVAASCLEKITKFLTCRKGTSFIIVTNQTVVFIDKAKKCCSTDDKVSIINPRYITEYGYNKGKTGCLCCKITGCFFYFKHGTKTYTIPAPTDEAELNKITAAFEAVVKNNG